MIIAMFARSLDPISCVGLTSRVMCVSCEIILEGVSLEHSALGRGCERSLISSPLSAPDKDD